MEIFKMGLVSDTWTAMVRNRVLRDMLLIDRLARKNGVQLVLAANSDLSGVFTGLSQITVTQDLVGCDTFRIYIDHDHKIESPSYVADPLAVVDRLPEDADYVIVELNKGKQLPQLYIERDPYAGKDHKNPDVQIIQPVIDLDRPPPKFSNEPDDMLY